MSYSNLNTSTFSWISLALLVLLIVMLAYRRPAWELGDSGRWSVVFFLLVGLFAAAVALTFATR